MNHSEIDFSFISADAFTCCANFLSGGLEPYRLDIPGSKAIQEKDSICVFSQY